MALASDLVTDSKLETTIKKDITIHVIQTTGTTPLQRKSRKKQKWEKVRDLGRGSFGLVRLEKLIGGESRVQERAVKEIEKKKSVTDYSHELHAIAKFSQDRFNSSFVESFGWYENDQHVFISMEYLSHGDLGRYLDEFGTLPQHEVQQIAHQILDGLQCMHEHKFIHRDLKPQNVLIKERGPQWWVKLGDFGISKRMEDAAKLDTYTGTDGFMAPEVPAIKGYLTCEALAGCKSQTSAVDIWALGVLLYQALAGSLPFKDSISYVKLEMPFPGDVLHTYNVSQNGCDLIERFLTIIPENRPTASKALEDPWFISQKPLPLRESIESLRPSSTAAETGQTIRDLCNLARQKTPTMASLSWSDAEGSTVVSKALDTVKDLAKERFPTLARRKGQTVQLDSHDNALGLTTLVEEPSPYANDSADVEPPTDDPVQQDPLLSKESLVGSDINQSRSSTYSARVECVRSLTTSEEERRPASTMPSNMTPLVTLRSAMDSPDSLHDSEEYFDLPIASDDFTLSPDSTLSEASPSHSTSKTSPRAPSGHWTRAMPLSQLSLDRASPVSPAWSKDPSIVRQKGCSLRPLYLPNDLTHTMDPDAFVVIVPGLGDPPVEIWSRDGMQNEPLVRDLTKHFMNIQVLALEHGLRVNGKEFNNWNQVRDSSHTMMQLLHEYREETDKMSIPIVFLGHGIGGIMVKDFFWKSSRTELRDFPTRWHEDLVNNTVGIILLGTPHLTSENIVDHANILGLITRSPTSRRSKTIDRKLMELDSQTQYLCCLSEEFDKYIRQSLPNLPILSIWDGRESKAMRVEETKLMGRRWRAEKYVIVTYELAKIGLPNEQMMVADCDHYELCTHNNPEFRQKLITFCHEKLLEAHSKMFARSATSSSVAVSTVLSENSNVASPF